MHAWPCTGALAASCCVHLSVAHLSHISGLNAANALRMLDLMSLGGSLEILMQVCRMDSGTILACRQKQGEPYHTGSVITDGSNHTAQVLQSSGVSKLTWGAPLIGSAEKKHLKSACAVSAATSSLRSRLGIQPCSTPQSSWRALGSQHAADRPLHKRASLRSWASGSRDHRDQAAKTA